MLNDQKKIIYLDSEILQDLMQKILVGKSVDKEAATRVSEGLVQTSLRGIDSHGINLFPHYCRAVEAGRINKKPKISVEQNACSVAIVDADHAFGHHSGSVAVQHAIKMAKENGIGAVGVKNSSHFGSAAYFAFQANKENCIGMAFTNGDALVKIYNSKEIFFGTNPICFTAPLKNEDPFCIDMATSQVAWNKVQNYKRLGMKLEEGWAYDIDGKETIDAEKANSLVSIGKYKGYGLGMMVDILCATLIGGVISKDMLSMHKSPINEKRMVSHFFMVIDISKFINIDTFKDNLQEMVDRIRKYEKSDTEDVMVAGDPEKKSFKKRSEEGIPVDEDKFEELISISAEIKNAVKK